MSEELLRTPLYDEHRRLGARMVPFAGWEMPVQYQSIVQEHRAVREAVGMFDVSHMGEFRVRGPGATALLQRLTPNDVSTLQPGTAQYSCLLRENGGMVDDIFIYRLEDSYLVVVNASNIAKAEAWFAAHPAPDATVTNESAETALIAVQGPLALEAIGPLVQGDLATLPRRGIRQLTVAGVPALVARTGYTGEDGAEIFVAADKAVTVWRALLEQAAHPIQPCGLGARDTLRLEAGNLLYGHDMDDSVNPVEAGLNFILKFEKGDFVGRDALLRAKNEGVAKRLVGFEMIERGVPRSEFPIQWEGRTVGWVTSGSYAPTLERNIGLAYVEPALATVGQELDVVIRERPTRARVVKLPFYRAPKRPAPRPA
ncbi:MAG TPA: glycine cleavage system aminomethyltransferase GcvT [Chloroflexota bacterium]|nr:glycine cleavage system aminomethyltransferase GcvT [Chloroflexota bacterium]